MEYFQMIMSLIGVLAIVFVLFGAMKYLNKRVAINSTGNMKIIERVNLAQDKMLLLVSVCGKCMVLCVTPNGCDKVCDVDMTEEELLASGQNTDFTAAFKGIFKEKMKNK